MIEPDTVPSMGLRSVMSAVLIRALLSFSVFSSIARSASASFWAFSAEKDA